MNTIADFIAADRRIVETALKERYEEPVEPRLADREARPDPDASKGPRRCGLRQDRRRL